jgi:16S rRNA (uracil1498-N3)-methyltransferase
VSTIVPLAAERSEKALLAAAAKRADRWRKILLEASQQSRRVRVPVLDGLSKPGGAFASRKDALGVLLSEQPTASSLRKVLQGQQATNAIVAIGPEGGWTEAEFAVAQRGGFLEASLGRRILRTETAVVTALASLNFALGDD